MLLPQEDRVREDGSQLDGLRPLGEFGLRSTALATHQVNCIAMGMKERQRQAYVLYIRATAYLDEGCVKDDERLDLSDPHEVHWTRQTIALDIREHDGDVVLFADSWKDQSRDLGTNADRRVHRRTLAGQPITVGTCQGKGKAAVGGKMQQRRVQKECAPFPLLLSSVPIGMT